MVEIGFTERNRFMDAQPCAPEHDDHGAKSATADAIPGCTHDGHGFLDLGRTSLSHPLGLTMAPVSAEMALFQLR
jgi:hypothetical protein